MCKDPNFMPFLVAFVPQLTMVDYMAVLSHDREVANAKHKPIVDRLITTEDKLIRRASVVEAEEQVKLLHKDAFVDGFEGDKFWYSLFENDFEGKSIMQLGDTEDIQIVYKELFRNSNRNMFDTGMQFYELRRNEKQAYDIAVKEEMDRIQKAGNVLTEEFVEYGAATLKDIIILVNLKDDAERKLQHGMIHELPEEYPDYVTQLNDMVKEYVKKLHTVWATLINNEVEVDEQYEDINDLLDRSIREIIQNWVEQLRGQFASLRDVEQQLFERLIESIVTYGEFRLSDTTIPENLKELVMDKDSLQNYLQLSHDKHISVIDSTEDQLGRRLKDWQEAFSIGMQVKEYQRNRARLEEISHFTNTHHGYLEDTLAFVHTTDYIPPVRGDQECTDPDVCKPLQWYERLTKRLRAKEKKFNASMMPKGSKIEAKEKAREGGGEGADGESGGTKEAESTFVL
ncbi:dynein regulatory complex subunit 3 [Folsomia candida]|nr:dynein regulatory complex subunit 3 [Folsomia candida]